MTTLADGSDNAPVLPEPPVRGLRMHAVHTRPLSQLHVLIKIYIRSRLLTEHQAVQNPPVLTRCRPGSGQADRGSFCWWISTRVTPHRGVRRYAWFEPSTAHRGTGGQILTFSQRHVRVWPLFAGVSLAGGGRPVGHNRTRPPPCMRWRGPCSTCRSRLATAPSSTGSDGPTAGASHPRPVSGFPAPFRVPREFPPGECPFPTWEYFYSLRPARRKGPEEATGIFFVIHSMAAVIHA